MAYSRILRDKVDGADDGTGTVVFLFVVVVERLALYRTKFPLLQSHPTTRFVE